MSTYNFFMDFLLLSPKNYAKIRFPVIHIPPPDGSITSRSISPI